MSYLTNKDYWVIQDKQLGQLIQQNPANLVAAQNTAQEELTSYLVQRWDCSFEFRNTNVYNTGKIYLPGDRIILDFPIYSTTVSYNIGNTIISNGTAYVAISNTFPGAFDPTKWLSIGNQYDMFTGNYPYPQFNEKSVYLVGDQVYWNGYVYTATANTTIQSRESMIQYANISDIPLPNVFPDSPQNADATYWGNKTAYSIPVNTSPQNTAYWTIGDSRSQQMVMYMTDIAIFHLHRAISPMNIPEMRKTAYKDAIGWLKSCSLGNVTPNLPEKQPQQGLKFRWGGKTHKNNDW